MHQCSGQALLTTHTCMHTPTRKFLAARPGQGGLAHYALCAGGVEAASGGGCASLFPTALRICAQMGSPSRVQILPLASGMRLNSSPSSLAKFLCTSTKKPKKSAGESEPASPSSSAAGARNGQRRERCSAQRARYAAPRRGCHVTQQGVRAPRGGSRPRGGAAEREWRRARSPPTLRCRSRVAAARRGGVYATRSRCQIPCQPGEAAPGHAPPAGAAGRGAGTSRTHASSVGAAAAGDAAGAAGAAGASAGVAGAAWGSAAATAASLPRSAGGTPEAPPASPPVVASSPWRSIPARSANARCVHCTLSRAGRAQQ